VSQRISLTRIIAINWYGFRQVFEVNDNVLLGEHWRANRAATGNACGRDLVGYCLGDTNQTGVRPRGIVKTIPRHNTRAGARRR
jgi:hypothetical protein